MSNISEIIRSRPLIRTILTPLILVRRAFVNDRRIPLLHKIMSHVKSGSVLIEMQDFKGDFELSVHSHLAYRVMLYGHYEPEYAEICRKECNPNRDAIDVGANIGFYSVLLGKTVASDRKVLSIEPTEAAFTYLTANIIRNGLTGKVLQEQVIAADKEETQSLTVFVGNEEYSSVGDFEIPNVPNANRQTVDIRGRTIDALCSEHHLDPGFIKIDVEGFEFQVLRGAKATLQQHGPTLIIEIGPRNLEACGTKVSELYTWLDEVGYSYFDASKPNKKPSSFFNGYLLAKPKEQMAV